jgi:predicted dehydrogenase
MSDLAAAVVGTGFIGPVHVEALRRAGVEVVGILGSTPDKSIAAARRLGIPKGYSTFDELLADKRVHVVHLTTPNRFHFGQASAALAAGKHVLCEKPLAMNSGESATLVKLAEQSGRVAGVCYNVRFYPLCLEAAERVRRGDIGDLYHVTGSYAQDWLLEETDFNWRVLADEGGPLRAVADIGTHWLDLIQFITGRAIDEVFADLKTLLPTRRRRSGNLDTFTGSSSANVEGVPVEISTEDYGCVMFRMGGARGVLWVSQVTAGRKNCLRFELAGSRRALAWDGERPNELWIGRRDGPNETVLRDPSLLSPAARRHADYPGGHNEGFPDTFKQLFRSFYEYIRAGDCLAPPTFPTFADGHREILLCEAILESHRQQRWVRL